MIIYKSRRNGVRQNGCSECWSFILGIAARERAWRKGARPVVLSHRRLPFLCMRPIQIKRGSGVFKLERQDDEQRHYWLISESSTYRMMLSLLTSSAHKMPCKRLKPDNVVRRAKRVTKGLQTRISLRAASFSETHT